jgi:AraC-like DNA-binding protein
MQLDFYRPHDPLLSDFIEGYYFLKETEIDKNLKYFTFPNNFFILSALTDSMVFEADGCINCRPTNAPNFQANLTCNYKNPLLINYEGAVNEVTVYFKPLGLNAFVSDINYHQNNKFSNFNHFSDFEEVMKNILEMQDRTEQIKLLEQYWISKISFTIEPLLLKMLNELEKGESISNIASKLGISRQYMNRLFLKNFGKSPTDFRKIQRFRNAVQANAVSKNLTDLALGSLFYDQSHFIRNIKELTSFSPKTFFEKASVSQENLWLYI